MTFWILGLLALAYDIREIAEDNFEQIEFELFIYSMKILFLPVIFINNSIQCMRY